VHDHDYDEAGRCEQHILELEADLSDARRRWETDYKEWNADREQWNGFLRERRILEHDDHMTRLDRIAEACERIAAALDGKASMHDPGSARCQREPKTWDTSQVSEQPADRARTVI
jgi:hypothetical protein